jgi:hypothetical protein
MIGASVRLLWRVFVGALAVFIAYFVLFLFYPYLHAKFPLLICLIILYVITAYFGIPVLVRLWRLVIRPKHLPHYTVSRDGWSSDPVNIAVVCKDEKQLKKAMEKAGWYIADKPTVHNMLREGYAILFNQPYPTAPFSNLYLFGRKQDIGFQIQTGEPATPRHRHHVRFWQLQTEEEPHKHISFWENIFQIFPVRKRQIWIGAATHDVKPFALRIQNLQITHQIDKETNKERDYLIDSLENAHMIKRCETLSAGDPIRFRGQTLGVNITTDGTLRVVELKRH